MNSKQKPYHILICIEDSIQKYRKFSTKAGLSKFKNSFLKEHTNPHDGYWIDAEIYDISGPIVLFDSTILVGGQK